MTTRAKFVCNEVTKKTGWNGVPFMYGAKFSVVTGNSDENKEFFASTPGGTIEVSTVRSDHFEPGKQYYVDFTEAN